MKGFESPMIFEKRFKITEVAKIMGKSPQFVRVGLQRGLLPFGTAIKMPGSTEFSYYINPVKFAEFMGVNPEQFEGGET